MNFPVLNFILLEDLCLQCFKEVKMGALWVFEICCVLRVSFRTFNVSYVLQSLMPRDPSSHLRLHKAVMVLFIASKRVLR